MSNRTKQAIFQSSKSLNPSSIVFLEILAGSLKIGLFL